MEKVAWTYIDKEYERIDKMIEKLQSELPENLLAKIGRLKNLINENPSLKEQVFEDLDELILKYEKIFSNLEKPKL